MAPRPPLPDDEKRSRRVYARVTEDEYQRLLAMADAAGMPIGEYVRETLLNRRPKPKPTRSRTMDEAMTELQRIATNFQQLADATGDEAFAEWADWVGSSFAEALLAREDLGRLVADRLETINSAGQVVNALARKANSGETVWDEDANEACEVVETALRPLLDALEGGVGGQGTGGAGNGFDSDPDTPMPP